jgi:hypothetical protein
LEFLKDTLEIGILWMRISVKYAFQEIGQKAS